MYLEGDCPPVDICIVVEGCYPFVSGGVSSWIDWLIRTQPDRSFGIVAIMADETPRQPKYAFPENVRFLQVIPLAPALRRPRLKEPVLDTGLWCDLLCEVLGSGSATAFRDLVHEVATPHARKPFPRLNRATPLSIDDLMSSQAMWKVMTECHTRMAPASSFPDFFWAWRSLVGGMFALLTAPLPTAKLYHAISTGYAGLYAARAAVVHDRPSAITEHGIYTNERRIDLVMADWIVDVIQSGMGDLDTRMDVRDFWSRSFASYAGIAYALSDRITTLYGANQSFQRYLGAEEKKLSVIPNGIELAKFQGMTRADRACPTVAIIGRVVPIKDIQAFISAAAIVHAEVPQAEILILGPTDEDEAYYELCRRRVAELGLEGRITFTGKVDIFDYLPRIDVLVLTSISEAQPLVLLEAGAARVPCVVTDVGSCREIIEGTPDEVPNLGMGGRVVPVMDTKAIGAAIIELLRDEELRKRCGEALRQRVEQRFTSEASAARYGALYAELERV
jgi:polysaccharide biosynthesis protein PelF